jgi:hypothetical protein
MRAAALAVLLLLLPLLPCASSGFTEAIHTLVAAGVPHVGLTGACKPQLVNPEPMYVRVQKSLSCTSLLPPHHAAARA